MSFKIVYSNEGRGEILVKSLSSSRTKEKGNLLRFHLALAGTALSDLDELSAAGIDADSRRKTPALDSEALLLPLKGGLKLPASPMGVTSPVVLSRAALDFLSAQISIADCGTFSSPSRVPYQNYGQGAAARPASGLALPLDTVRHLFDQGQKNGRHMGQEEDTLIALAECVPGGTSTAACLLELLGVPALSRVSASLTGTDSLDNSAQEKRLSKAQILKEELQELAKKRNKSLGNLQSDCLSMPLLAVSLAGDPMQAYAAGFLLGAAEVFNAKKGGLNMGMGSGTPVPVIAAGGSQMLAIWHLANLLSPGTLSQNCLIVTTSYVADDSHAQVAELAKSCRANLISFDPCLQLSSHAGLRAYTRGHVKEGVGAGASCFLASLLGRLQDKELVSLIDRTYGQMVALTQ